MRGKIETITMGHEAIWNVSNFNGSIVCACLRLHTHTRAIQAHSQGQPNKKNCSSTQIIANYANAYLCCDVFCIHLCVRVATANVRGYCDNENLSSHQQWFELISLLI